MKGLCNLKNTLKSPLKSYLQTTWGTGERLKLNLKQRKTFFSLNPINIIGKNLDKGTVEKFGLTNGIGKIKINFIYLLRI